MTLRGFLHDRIGFDAIYAQSVVVVICGVAVEGGAVLLFDAISRQRIASELIYFGREEVLILGAVGAFLLVTTSLGYGLAFALCRILDLRPWLTRVFALLTAPLGSSIFIAILLLGPLSGFGSEDAIRPTPVQLFYSATVGCYTIIGLPLLVAAFMAARTIKKSRVNAEAVFGGTN